MGRIKSWFLSLPLKRAFICLVFCMAILVAGLSGCVIAASTAMRNHLLDTVTVPISSFVQQEDRDSDGSSATAHIVIAGSDQITQNEDGVLVLRTIEHRLQNLSSRNRLIYYGLGIAMIAVPCLLFAAGTLFCAWVFYAVKLKKPLALLMKSAERISQNELDFKMDCDSSDEMGQLCRVMDKMRASLQKSNQEMWNMMEERRKLNASIAHDLRTPLTVMKGYTEYLSRNVPLGRISEAKLTGTIQNLVQATERMEAYVDQVRDIQALNALPVRKEPVNLPVFFDQEEETCIMLAGRHGLRFELRQKGIPAIPLLIDKTLVERAIDNVISNSIRYAREWIVMEVQWQNSNLSVTIFDDGPGFSDDALKKAGTVFYKENSGNDHFGLGLFICDTLCRKQGGMLALRNGENGGACITLSIEAAVSEETNQFGK